jgi:signal transduction histidine kinase
VVALLIFIVSTGADFFLLRDREPARFTIELSDAISSGVIGLLSYKLFRLQQQRREYVRRRLEIVADMNHHVRNALQVISLTTQGRDKDELGAIRESMDRIQWALKELLPKI